MRDARARARLMPDAYYDAPPRVDARDKTLCAHDAAMMRHERADDDAARRAHADDAPRCAIMMPMPRDMRERRYARAARR